MSMLANKGLNPILGTMAVREIGEAYLHAGNATFNNRDKRKQKSAFEHMA